MMKIIPCINLNTDVYIGSRYGIIFWYFVGVQNIDLISAEWFWFILLVDWFEWLEECMVDPNYIDLGDCLFIINNYKYEHLFPASIPNLYILFKYHSIYPYFELTTLSYLPSTQHHNT